MQEHLLELHQRAILDSHWEGYELAVDETHRFLALRFIYNIRLISVPKGETGRWGYDYAWCYPLGLEAVAASVAAWNPITQDEPIGWHKRSTPSARRAPQRGKEPEYDRLRCVHGSYFVKGCKSAACLETLEAR